MTIDPAFAALPDGLRAQIFKAIEQYPETRNVFLALYSHFTNLYDPLESKKRKLTPTATPASAATLSNTSTTGTGATTTTTSSIATLDVDADKCLRIPGVSVQIPVRKRLDIFLAPDGRIILQKPGASLSDPPEFSLAAAQIRAVYLLPIPEKTRPHWALLITQKDISAEPLLATITIDATRTVVKPVEAATGELYSGDVNDMVLLYFQRQNLEPTSAQTLPPGQNLVQVSAHRGSKDGVLYFLPGAVIFGFKKPVLVFELGGIRAISYSSITSSTFNLIVKYKGENDEAATETEFSMIDQRNFEDINRYVDYHGLSNESLAEERRAKVDAKAVFPDELIRASREESKKEQQQPQQSGSTTDQVNLANHDFDSEDDEDDADFGDGGDQNEDDESESGSEDESEDIGDSD